MISLRLFFFVALALACVFAVDPEPERVKKDVIVGGYHPYGYSAGFYSGAYPYAYSGYPAAYSAYSGYAGYPYYRSAYYY